MADDSNWAALRSEIVKSFNGMTPRPEDEAPIIEVFEQNPDLVKRVVEDTAAKHVRGEVNWPWAIAASRLRKAMTPIRDVTVKTGGQRERAVVRAEQWIKTAGVHYDREAEVDDELFGDRGMLHPWAGETVLKQRLLDLWRENRPRGEQVERDQIARAEQWKATQRILKQAAVKDLNDEIEPQPAEKHPLDA